MEKQHGPEKTWRKRGIFALVSSRPPLDAPIAFPESPEDEDPASLPPEGE